MKILQFWDKKFSTCVAAQDVERREKKISTVSAFAKARARHPRAKCLVELIFTRVYVHATYVLMKQHAKHFGAKRRAVHTYARVYTRAEIGRKDTAYLAFIRLTECLHVFVNMQRIQASNRVTRPRYNLPVYASHRVLRLPALAEHFACSPFPAFAKQPNIYTHVHNFHWNILVGVKKFSILFVGAKRVKHSQILNPGSSLYFFWTLSRLFSKILDQAEESA